MLDTDRPWLRKDTIYASVPDGLLISNASTGFEIAGKSAYALFQKVAPLFDGQVTVGEIRHAVPENTWNIIQHIIDPLVKQGFLRWIPAGDVDLVPTDVRESYPDQIAFLAQYTDNPHAAFKRFHDAKIAITGENDPILDSLANNLEDNGAANVLQVEHVAQVVNADLVIIGPTGLSTLNEVSEITVPTLVICPAARHLWALPVRWEKGACSWQDGNNSISRGMYADEWERSFTAAQDGAPVWDYATSSEAVQRLFGALLSYEVFKGLSGAIAPETGHAIFGINCLTGETRVHRVTPIFADSAFVMPPELATSSYVARPWSPPNGQSLVSFSSEDSRADEYDAVWSRLVDPVTAPATDFLDLALPQVPIKISAVQTSWGPVRAASAWTTADARIDAIATAYSLALTAHARPGGESASVVLAAERSREEAVRVALEVVFNETSPARSMRWHADDTASCTPEIPGRLGTFIAEISDSSIIWADLGKTAGFYIVRASYDGRTWIGAGLSAAEARARAALHLLGNAQAGVEEAEDVEGSSHIDLSSAFANVLTVAPTISIVDLSDNWYLAIVRAGESN
ncbi:hypothetical protein [Ancrocorticia populi]|uniref:hypothetical protein n=1 Tax=Ancrocorticia populi TaxID=2175228 RepID=UPI0014027E3F|nr:hypothetical protein [Ancrocorticia populi]MDN6486418.1 hypothetical protein [Ancrocorticia sp.]